MPNMPRANFSSLCVYAAALIAYSWGFAPTSAFAAGPDKACLSVIEGMAQPIEASSSSGADVFLGFAEAYLGGQWKEEIQQRAIQRANAETNLTGLTVARADRAGQRSKHSFAYWEESVRAYTKGASSKEARRLLSVLEGRLSGEEILALFIGSIAHFQSVGSGNPLSNFHIRLKVYDEYLGRRQATEFLRQSFGGFLSGDPKEWMRLTLFLEDYYSSKEAAIAFMRPDFGYYASAELSEIERAMAFLARHIGKAPPDAKRQRMKIDPRQNHEPLQEGLSNGGPLRKIQAISNFLRPFLKYDLPPGLPRFNEARLQEILRGLTEKSSDVIEPLSQTAKYFEQWLRERGGAGKIEAARIMWRGLEHFVNTNSFFFAEDLRDKISYLENQLTNRKIIQFILEAPEVFWLAPKSSIIKEAVIELRSLEPPSAGLPARQGSQTRGQTSGQIRGQTMSQIRGQSSGPASGQIRGQFMQNSAILSLGRPKPLKPQSPPHARPRSAASAPLGQSLKANGRHLDKAEEALQRASVRRKALSDMLAQGHSAQDIAEAAGVSIEEVLSSRRYQ